MSDSVKNVVDRINRTKNPLMRMRLGLRFFSKPSNYSRDAIGWGEDYASIDDGIKVAKAALKKNPKDKKRK